MNTTHSPILSILLPVYNVAPFLEECLFSIFSQKNTRVEVIALNDCSTDNSLSILRKIRDAYPELKIIEGEKNIGLSSARNRLLREAQGKYIWFVDSDDKLSVGAISRFFHIVETHSPDLIICDFFTLEQNKKKKIFKKSMRKRGSHAGKDGLLLMGKEAILVNTIIKDKLYAWSRIFRKSLCGNDLRFPDGRVFEDINFSIGLTARSEKTYYAKEPWVIYRRRSGSILATLNANKINDWRYALRSIDETLRLAGKSETVKLKMAVSYCIVKNYLEILKKIKENSDAIFFNEVKAEMVTCARMQIDELLKKLLISTFVFQALRIWKGKKILKQCQTITSK